MKKKNVFKLLISSSFLALVFPAIVVNGIDRNNDISNEIKPLNINEKNQIDLKNVNDIVVTNPDILKSSNFAQVRELLETPIMTQAVLNRLSITMPPSLTPRLVSFTNINNDLFKISFTINYNRVPKATSDFLNITPTEKEIVDSIVIENRDVLIFEDNNYIKGLLQTNPMTQTILNQLSVKTLPGVDITKISFTDIDITNPVRTNFKIKYNNTVKETFDYLSSTSSNKDIANSITIGNIDALVHLTVTQIRVLLEASPMTQEVLNQISAIIPDGINPSLVSFKRINISDPFKVTFTINYNNVTKDSPDVLNAILTNKQTAEASNVTNVNALSTQNINNIKAYLEQSPMNEETLDILSIAIPLRAQPENFTFTNIDISNPFRIYFTINYNGVPKGTSNFLNASPTDKEVANAITVSDSDILLDRNVVFIKNILDEPITQEVLDQLSITIPEGADLSKISFSNINISNLYKVTFRINYNLVSNDLISVLNATPSNKEVVEATILEDPNILASRNVLYIKGLLEAPVMTQDILKELSVKVPVGSTVEDFLFTNINIEDPFVVTFLITYRTVEKESTFYLNATPTNQEIANTIVITDPNIMHDKSVREVRDILEIQPLTQELLELLSIKVFSGVIINRITFTNINIQNLLRITFTINYNGVPKDTMDFYLTSATDSEIANSLSITNSDILKDLNGIEIRDLLETSPMSIEVLERLSVVVNIGIDATKITFNDIDIDNLFRVTFTISYNGVSKSSANFLNATPTNQEVVNRIFINNPNILREKNNAYIENLLRTPIMTREILDELSIVLLNGIDPEDISFSDINITNPVRIIFKINYNGVAKTTFDFLNTTQSDQEIVDAINIDNVDAVKGLRTLEIRKLLETQPLTIEVLNRLSISVPDGIQLYKITFTNININNLFQITFTINYNGVAKSNSSLLNATPSDFDILGVLEISDNEILINDSREIIEAKLSQPMSLDLLTSLSVIDIPVGIDVTKISFSNISISNPFRVTFNFTYNLTTKATPSWLTTKATDEEAVNAITVINPEILKIESNLFIKNLLEGEQTEETLKKLGIDFPDGGNIKLVSFTNINITNPYEVIFKMNYNGVPKATNDSLRSTPAQDIVEAIIIQNNDILVSENANFIENLLRKKPMTREILEELSIILADDIPADRITFTDIDRSNLFRISFRINYNGVGKINTDYLNTTPTDLDIANALVVTNVDILNNKDIQFVEELLKTSPMTKEILDQLSIILPLNIDAHRITFTNIDTSNPARIIFTVNYNGVAATNSSFINTKKPSSSNAVVIVSIIIPISAVLIVGMVGWYFWNKKKDDSGKGGPKKPLFQNLPKVMTKKPEAKKQKPAKPEIKKPEPAKPEIKKPEPAKPEVKKQESAKPEAKKLESAKPEVKKLEIPNIIPKKPDPKKEDIKQPERRNTYEEYFTEQMLDLTNRKINIVPKEQSNKQNAQWYGDQVNADWYNEQAKAQSYNDQNNKQWYNEQASDKPYPYPQSTVPNNNVPNQMNTLEQEQWSDNRWYSNQADTGHWENGDWYENKDHPNLKIKTKSNSNIVHTHDNYQFNNTQTDNKSSNQKKPQNTQNDKTKTIISDWTSIIDMIEK
ncbi:MAG: hypothetical protein ACRC7B_00760 [Metamycoplasmataceae bacterium]